MGILGSLLSKQFSSQQKTGLLGRAFVRGLKGSRIFALGYCTNHVLSLTHTAKLEGIFEEANKALVEDKSLTNKCKAQLVKLNEREKTVNDLKQLYEARMAMLDETQNAYGLIRGNGSEETI